MSACPAPDCIKGGHGLYAAGEILWPNAICATLAMLRHWLREQLVGEQATVVCAHDGLGLDHYPLNVVSDDLFFFGLASLKPFKGNGALGCNCGAISRAWLTILLFTTLQTFLKSGCIVSTLHAVGSRHIVVFNSSRLWCSGSIDLITYYIARTKLSYRPNFAQY